MKHSIQFSITIPSKDKNGNKFPILFKRANVINHTQLIMSDLFGGFTQYKTTGGYKVKKLIGNKSMSGGGFSAIVDCIMLERVLEISSFAKNLDKQEDFISLALYVKKELNQESVKIVINNDMFLI